MCGIVGIQFDDECACREGWLPEQEAFLRHLLLESQIRGKHSTGVAYYDAEDTLTCHTLPVPAESFVTSKHWRELLLHSPKRVLMHCRYSTSGDWRDNKNNQPIAAGGLAIVHNGIVSMASKEEFEEQYRVKTKTDNDSEVILRKTCQYLKNGNLVSALKTALTRVHDVHPPIFALGILSQDSVVATCDHIRPLYLFRCDKLALSGFCSTKSILVRAATAAGLDLEDIEYSKARPYYLYDLNNNVRERLEFSYPTEFRFKRPRLVDPLVLRNSVAPKADPRVDHKEAGWDKDYRVARRSAFLQYYAAVVKSWDVDPAYPALTYLFHRYELSKEQEYWTSWLYGVFYHVGTTFWFMQEFPEFEKVDLGRLERWHKENWRKLRYETDRRYCKGHLVEMFQSYKDLIGTGTQEDFFAGLLTSNDKKDNFRRVWAKVMTLRRFGRYACYYYTETLARSMGMPIEADSMFLKDALSSRNGLCYAIGRDDLVDAPMNKEIIRYLEEELERLMDDVREAYPDAPVDMWFMESALCAYKGLYRRRRYIGYYIDRLAEEILHMEADQAEATAGVDWKVLWQMRQATFMLEQLGEHNKKNPTVPPDHRWLGPREEWNNAMMDYGALVGLWPLRKRGLV